MFPMKVCLDWDQTVKTPSPGAALQQNITHLSKDLSLKCCVVYYFFQRKGEVILFILN